MNCDSFHSLNIQSQYYKSEEILSFPMLGNVTYIKQLIVNICKFLNYRKSLTFASKIFGAVTNG